MKIFIALVLCYTFVFSLPFELQKKDLLKIENTFERKQTTTRLLRYKEFLKEAKNFSLEKKLNRVNAHINRIRPKHDILKNQNGESAIGDYWMTPKEFFIAGTGDCEDYAIAKLYTLKYLGVDPKKLYLSVVKVKGSTSLHMVLLYIENKNKTPIVLDNLSWRVLPLTKRKDLTPQFAFNESIAYVFKNKKIEKKVKIDWGEENKWENFLKRLEN